MMCLQVVSNNQSVDSEEARYTHSEERRIFSSSYDTLVLNHENFSMDIAEEEAQRPKKFCTQQLCTQNPHRLIPALNSVAFISVAGSGTFGMMKNWDSYDGEQVVKDLAMQIFNYAFGGLAAFLAYKPEYMKTLLRVFCPRCRNI